MGRACSGGPPSSVPFPRVHLLCFFTAAYYFTTPPSLLLSLPSLSLFLSFPLPLPPPFSFSLPLCLYLHYDQVSEMLHDRYLGHDAYIFEVMIHTHEASALVFLVMNFTFPNPLSIPFFLCPSKSMKCSGCVLLCFCYLYSKSEESVSFWHLTPVSSVSSLHGWNYSSRAAPTVLINVAWFMSSEFKKIDFFFKVKN